MPRGGAGPDNEIAGQDHRKTAFHELRLTRGYGLLPPYERLDDIMRLLCEEMVDIETIVARGHDRDEVARASQLLFPGGI